MILRLWGPVWIAAAAIFYASVRPDFSVPEGLSDTSWHSLGYAALGFLIARAFAGGLGAQVAPAAALAAVFLSTAYGGLLELLQTIVPGRFGDWRDLVADAIGAAIGAVLVWLCGIILRSWPLKT